MIVKQTISCLIILASIVRSTIALTGEREEVQRLAPKYEAEVEFRLWDGTRVDMLTADYAIEADWSHKWAEAIGQSLYYAALTDKKPGIILLVKSTADEARFIYRCQTVCQKHDIRLWIEILPQ